MQPLLVHVGDVIEMTGATFFSVGVVPRGLKFDPYQVV